MLYLFLAGISWAIMAIFIYDPHLMYNHPVGVEPPAAVDGRRRGLCSRFFPTYFRAEWINVWLTVIYTELVIVIVWLGWKLIKQPIHPAAGEALLGDQGSAAPPDVPAT